MQQIAIVVFGLLVGAPQTQVTPNFAGMWTFDASKTAEAGQGAALRAGGQLSITQDGKQVTLVQPGPRGGTTTTYNLDGTETLVPLGASTVKASAVWSGGKLVVTIGSGATPMKRIYYLDGEYLVVETPTLDGGSTKMFYKKPKIQQSGRG